MNKAFKRHKKPRSLPEEMMCFVVKSGKMNFMTPPTVMNYPLGMGIHVNTQCPTSTQDFI